MSFFPSLRPSPSRPLPERLLPERPFSESQSFHNFNPEVTATSKRSKNTRITWSLEMTEALVETLKDQQD